VEGSGYVRLLQEVFRDICLAEENVGKVSFPGSEPEEG
jgi:hypothetical protein